VADTFNTYTYDPEGNITQINGGASGTYTYDERNDRVRIDAGGGAWEFLFGTNGRRASFWDAVHGYEVQEQTYWGSTPVVFNEAGYQQFQHQDWLGTERMRTTYSGAVDGSFVSLPYGDGYSVTGNDNDMYHFAGLDGSHAQFREYSSTQGRWMAPDPYSGSYDFTNPQSFNRYAYVMNDPMSGTDPLGLDPCLSGDEWCQPGCDEFSYCGPNPPPIGVGGGGYFPDPENPVYYPNRIMTERIGLPRGMQLPTGDIASILQGSFGLPTMGSGNCFPLCMAANGASTSIPWFINVKIPPEVWYWAMHGNHGAVHGAYQYGHWCGPGGKGLPIDDLDAYCLIHDYCYDRAGLSASTNVNGLLSNPALSACNQALCNGAMSVLNSNVATENEKENAVEVTAYFTIVPIRGSCSPF
jgi:RHS repeat-associated protein